MPPERLLEAIAGKAIKPEKAAIEVVNNPGLLEEIYRGLESKKPGVRYACSKILRYVSEKRPEMLYPRFDFFTGLLAGDNNILRWDAIFTIANLAGVDTENRFEAIFDMYFSPVPGPVLITAANTIKAAANIALARPELTRRITTELLKVEHAIYQTDECRNIALGRAIESFARFFDRIEDKQPVLEMVSRQVGNTRAATAKKAAAFLCRWGCCG